MEQERPFAKRNRGFDSVSIRIFTPNSRHFAVTALVFSSGAVVVVGGRSAAQIREAQALVARKTDSQATPIRVRNIACTFCVSPLLLEAVFEAFRDEKRLYSSSYDPELFPAVMVHERGSRKKACIFHSGRINVTGCLSIAEALEMKNMVLESLTIYSGEGVTEID